MAEETERILFFFNYYYYPCYVGKDFILKYFDFFILTFHFGGEVRVGIGEFMRRGAQACFSSLRIV